MFIGIDPGMDGAIVVMDADGVIVSHEMMPTIGVKRRKLDGQRVKHRLGLVKAKKSRSVLAILEDVHSMPRDGAVGAFSFGAGWGEIKGILLGMGIPLELVAPQTWKKVILEGTPKDKDAAVAYVHRRFPGVDLLPGKKRKPHDGLADAVCIAEYGRRKFGGGG